MMLFLLSLLLVLFVFLLAFHLKLLFERKTKPQGHLKYPPSPPSIPIIGHLHLLKPLIHQAFRDISLRYGPLLYLRIGSVQFVVVSSPKLAKEFLKTNELIYSSRKMNMAINMVTYHKATFAFAPYDTYWKFMKKLSTTELLGNQTIAQFLPLRTREVHEFIRTLFDKSKAKESVNLTEALLGLSNNIISQMMLSIKSSGTESQAEKARALVREVTQIFGEFNVSDFIGFCKNLDLQGFETRAMDIHKRYDALLEKIISDREESRRKSKIEGCEDRDEKVKDFLDILLDVAEQKECEVDLTRNHVKSLILKKNLKGFYCLEVETDSACLADMLQNGCHDNHDCSEVINQIQNFSQQGGVYRWNHIYREANTVADALAKFALSISGPAKIFDVALPFFSRQLHADDYFTAATDTTAISVEWAITELFNHPKVLKKAQEEVDRITRNDRLVHEVDSPNLPYIHAIIKETMRLHPSIPMIMRKGIEDCAVDEKMIPKGSIICVNIWAMGRDPNIWENPLEFRPERFLEGERSTIDIKGHHFELLPFGSGRRGCPGMPLAMRELPTIIGALIQCFEWKMFGSQGEILDYDDNNLINMDERPGLTTPRANDLIGMPIVRLNPTPFLQV